LKEEKINPDKVYFHLNNTQKREPAFGKKLVKFHDIFVHHITSEKKNE